jgi:hypothetical protein
MAAIYISMQELLPVSFDEQAFRSKENEPKIKAFLKSLADNGEALSLHGSKREQGFKFLSETFESDVKQTYQWFVQGDTEGARFYLHNIIDDCVACHSKLPTESAKMGTDGLFKQMAIERLAPLEKARLYVAMRQFDEAMTTYEDHFLDLVKKGDAAMALDAFGDYLKIAIRVKGDLKRPLVTLDKVRSEDKLPEFLVRLTAAWQEDLKLLEKQKIFNKIEISEANRLIEYGKKRMIFARDRIGVVPYTAASAILHRVVDQKDLDSKKISEAYYLLGVSESLISQSLHQRHTHCWKNRLIWSSPARPA